MNDLWYRAQRTCEQAPQRTQRPGLAVCCGMVLKHHEFDALEHRKLDSAGRRDLKGDGEVCEGEAVVGRRARTLTVIRHWLGAC